MKRSVFCKIVATLLLALGTFTGVAQTTLVSTGSVWKYLDDGSDQGVGWRALDFIESWASGPAELGFGDNDEATVINGGLTNARIATVYFRHIFNVADTSTISNLTVRLRRDDGGIVYINDMEVFRSNLPEGTVLFDTYTGTGTASETAFFPTNVNLGVLVNGPNIIAVEIHQQNMTSSDMSFELELVANAPWMPPTVSIVNPTNTAAVTNRTIAINATAADADATVSVVHFYQGAVLLGSDSAAPYNFAWTGVAPGSYTLRAVAVDSQGLSATSAPVNITVVAPPPALIQFGSSWKYLDDGSDQVFWTDPGFVDTDWFDGVGQFGYGDNDEATVIGFGPNSTNKYITTFFRHHFTLTAGQLASISNLVVRLLRDDGGIVYLNGFEILRSNMTNENVGFQTPALEAVEDSIHSAGVELAFLAEGENVVAVEIHQSSGTSSDLSFDLQLQHNVTPVLPLVTITNPASGAAFLAPVNITIAATATDPDGAVTLVEFFANGSKIGESAPAPYSITWSNVPPGNYALTARALDETGFTGASAPVNITVLSGGTTIVATGSTWTYLDDGSDQTLTDWKTLFFDDFSWGVGAAQLGYGDGDEVTVVRSNRLDGSKIITTYFRQLFEIPDASIYSNLIVRLQRDDGAVVYLNTNEIFRSNMPTGAVDYLTQAAGNTTSETAFFQRAVNPAFLQSGVNILAVEIHQESTNSSDISFDLTLIGNVPAAPPSASITSPANGANIPQGNVTITATAADRDGHVTLVEFFANGSKIGEDATEPYTMVWAAAPGSYALVARATDSNGATTNSAPVNVTILPGTTLTLRQGLNGYDGTDDTDLHFAQPDNADRGTNLIVLVDGQDGTPAGQVHGLLRFNNIVGSSSNQIPAGANVVLANLSFRTANGSVSNMFLHRMLVTWTEASTWNSMNTGITANGSEAQAVPDGTFLNNTVGDIVTLNVTPTVQAWINGEINHGWAFLPTGTDGYQFNSSETGTAAQRPTLTVTYTTATMPTLQIEFIAGQVRLSWTTAPGFILEETTALGSGWSTSASQSNPQMLAPAGTAKFFRLRQTP